MVQKICYYALSLEDSKIYPVPSMYDLEASTLRGSL